MADLFKFESDKNKVLFLYQVFTTTDFLMKVKSVETVVKADRVVKETGANNMDDKINPCGNWVRCSSSLGIMLVSQSSSSKVMGCMESPFSATLIVKLLELYELMCLVKVPLQRTVLKNKFAYNKQPELTNEQAVE